MFQARRRPKRIMLCLPVVLVGDTLAAGSGQQGDARYAGCTSVDVAMTFRVPLAGPAAGYWHLMKFLLFHETDPTQTTAAQTQFPAQRARREVCGG
jgi:hypothetical protein